MDISGIKNGVYLMEVTDSQTQKITVYKIKNTKKIYF